MTSVTAACESRALAHLKAPSPFAPTHAWGHMVIVDIVISEWVDALVVTDRKLTSAVLSPDP